MEVWPARVLSTLLFTFISAGVTVSGFAQEASPELAHRGTENHTAETPSLVKLLPWVSQLQLRASTIESTMSDLVDLDEVEEKLLAIERDLDPLIEESNVLTLVEAPEYIKLQSVKALFHNQSEAIHSSTVPLDSAIRQLEVWLNEWASEEQRLSDWDRRVAFKELPPTATMTLVQAQEVIDDAQAGLGRELERLLALQKLAFDLELNANKQVEGLNTKLRQFRSDLLEGGSEPIFGKEFVGSFNRGLWFVQLEGIRQIRWPELASLPSQGKTLSGQMTLSILLAFGIRRTRSRFLQSRDAEVFARRPISIAVFLGFALGWPFSGGVPQIWELFHWLVLGGCLCRLMPFLVIQNGNRRMLHALVAITALSQITLVLATPLPILRLILVATSFITLIIAAFRICGKNSRNWNVRTIAVASVALAIPLTVIVCDLLGYSYLAVLVFRSSLRSIFLLITLYALNRLVRVGLETVLTNGAVQRFYPAGDNAKDAVDRIILASQVVLSVLYFGLILVSWRLYDTPLTPVQEILRQSFRVGNLETTAGTVLLALLIFVASFVTSSALQSLLLMRTLSTQSTDRGLWISVGRILHYVLVFIAGLIALTILGVNLMSIVLIASGLGVGIGFGLQSIVSNFFSGLILLIERPIKVGDVVELDQRWATIRRIGLRATVVETFDRAEVVVPNTDLVSNQVTNWTLSSRGVRLVLSIGVAYGSEVELVMRTLLDCAECNEHVLRDPESRVLFRGFEDSALAFELWVWIGDVDRRLTTTSELYQEIDRRFRELRIVIPYPQRDLHLRSAEAK